MPPLEATDPRIQFHMPSWRTNSNRKNTRKNAIVRHVLCLLINLKGTAESLLKLHTCITKEVPKLYCFHKGGRVKPYKWSWILSSVTCTNPSFDVHIMKWKKGTKMFSPYIYAPIGYSLWGQFLFN